MKTKADPMAVIRYYAEGYSLRETGRHFDCSLETVRGYLRRYRPDLIRAPSVGMNKSPRERLAQTA